MHGAPGTTEDGTARHNISIARDDVTFSIGKKNENLFFSVYTDKLKYAWTCASNIAEAGFGPVCMLYVAGAVLDSSLPRLAGLGYV